MFYRRATIVILLATAVSTVHGSYWVSEFTESPDSYRIARSSGTIPLEQLMLLETGDIIHVSDRFAMLVVINEQNERIAVTQDNSPFVVPESEAPPTLLINIRNWMASWWSTRGNQSTSTTAAVSKGALEPKTPFAAYGENWLLSGSREIYVSWSGGFPPFEVQLVDSSENVVAQVTGVQNYAVALPRYELDEGSRFDLHISDGSGSSTAAITVAGKDRLPASVQSVIDLDVPDKIRFGNVALLLSVNEGWRFEALQLAHAYRLDELESRLLNGTLPQFQPDKLDLELHK